MILLKITIRYPATIATNSFVRSLYSLDYP